MSKSTRKVAQRQLQPPENLDSLENVEGMLRRAATLQEHEKYVQRIHLVERVIG
jgi:hypothetical protein